MGLASALSTALTGLNAAETMIDVAGNNISNANTVGFKQSDVEFSNQLLQTQGLGSSPTATSGGTNPEQVGLGTQVSEITPDFTQGTIQVTSNPDDLAITGDGFFIVQGDQGQQLYTRNGVFTTNANNQLVTTGGQLLLGQTVNSNFQITSTTLAPLTIPLGSASTAEATQNVVLQGTLPPDTSSVAVPSVIQSQVLSDGTVPVPTNLGTSANNLFVVTPPNTTGTSAAADSTTAGNLTNGGTYKYEVTYSYVDAGGETVESPPSAVVGPVTLSAAGDSIDLSGLPVPPTPTGTPAIPPYTKVNIYRTDSTGSGTYYKVGSVAAGTTTFNDGAADSTLTSDATLNTNTIAPGSYSYYVTYVNSATGLESRPTALIGPQTLTTTGNDIELNGLPTPPAGSGFNEIRIYRNTASNSGNFYQVATLPAGTASYIDSASDTTISANNQINLNGPPISAGTKLIDVVQLSNGTYTNPFQVGTINFTGTKGGATLDTKTFQVTANTTVADFQNFVDQAMGIQGTNADSVNPITGNPVLRSRARASCSSPATTAPQMRWTSARLRLAKHWPMAPRRRSI